MLSGIGGHLVSEPVLDARVNDGTRAPMPAALRTSLIRWRRSQQQLGPATSVRAMVEAGAAPLVRMLGFHTVSDVAFDADLCAATLRTARAPLALLVARWGERLDPLWRRATTESAARGAAWCLLFNGTHLRLIHTVRVFSRRFFEIDLDAAADDERTTTALWLVCAAPAFETGAGGTCTASALVEESERHASSVCRSLRDGVLVASSDILRALLMHRAGEPPDQAFEQTLTIVYRVLFLLFAEARALVPLWHPVYRQSYSVEALRIDAVSGLRVGLWDALRAMARLAHAGCSAGDLHVTPFNGRLFAPAATPLAERADLDDEAARRALVALSTRPAADGEGREPIAYQDLGVEQLGAVYETLLDYQPRVERRHRSAPLVVSLERRTGVRKATGTFYTPQSIASYLIRQTLAPLVHGRTPEQILELKVVDPAMGSGAFLVGACRYLAEAYEHAAIETGACLPSDLGADERARIRCTVAERCLYGVDLNPMAVQLARLSLWLATLARDRPLSFLDHHLAVGDSVLGAWVACLRTPARGTRRKAQSPLLFDTEPLIGTLRTVMPVRFHLGQEPNDTLEQVRAKERALAALSRHDAALTKWKRIADLWCARWFAADLHPPALFAPLSDEILLGRSELPRSTAASLLQASERVAATRRFLHWELEFPEAFFDARGVRRPDAGFDAVIGNPPWEMVRADADGTGSHAADLRGVVRFTRDAGVYAAQSAGHANCYQLFVERSIALVRPGGRLGLVLPSGLCMDHGSAALRQYLFSQCAVDGIVGFDNRRGIFPIHRGLRFVVMSATRGTATASIACRLGEVDPAGLDRPHDAAAAPGLLRLTPQLLNKISGPGLAIPNLRSAVDVAIAERAADRFLPLGDPAGWGARFGRELNATEDRALFGPPAAGLPIIEGKLLEPFRVRVDRARASLPAREAARRLGDRVRRARLAYRDVASATNRVTLIAAVLPPHSASTHTVFCLKTRLPSHAQWFLCGMFNSLVVNYLARLRVTTHVTTAIVEHLPIPRADQAGDAYREIAALARLLARRDDRSAWARLNARVATLYALDDRELSHLLATFPLIPEVERYAVRHLYLS